MQTIPILMNLLAAILGAVGQYLYKKGGQQLSQIPLIKNWPLYVGMVLFCVVMVLFVWSFKLGGKLSVVYPVYATTFVWGTLLAVWLDREPVNVFQWVGVGIILLGVFFVAAGAPKGV